MLITMAVCLPLGAVIGIKFNVKMIVHAIVAAALLFSFVSLMGAETIGTALINTIVAAVCLQVGYFVSLMLFALGFIDNAAAPIENPGAEATHSVPELGKKI